MTETEILLTAVCVFLVAWCFHMNRRLDAQRDCIARLQNIALSLQGFANHQLTINSKTEEVQSILEDVNASLKKIVGEAGEA